MGFSIFHDYVCFIIKHTLFYWAKVVEFDFYREESSRSCIQFTISFKFWTVSHNLQMNPTIDSVKQHFRKKIK